MTLVSVVLNVQSEPVRVTVSGSAGLKLPSEGLTEPTVTVSVAPEALHWFDGERETRLPS